MTTPSENDEPTARQLQNIEQLLAGLSDGQKQLNDRLTGLSTRQDDQAGAVDMLTAKIDSLAEEVKVRSDGIRNDLGEVRGAHARSAVTRNTTLLADTLDCTLISEVEPGILLGFSRMAAEDKEPPDDVKSFQQADLVLHVFDKQGHPRYLAIEASFTVADRDIDRAIRNARYLRQYAGLRADPVVAGVEVLPGAQVRIDEREAQLYRIERRDLQTA